MSVVEAINEMLNVMPFGLANAPRVLQGLMSAVLEGQEDYAVAYLDAILVFSDTVENHLILYKKF